MPSTSDVVAPGDRRRRDTRARLIDASLLLFASKGFAGTTIAEIERAVGLRPGSGALYRHFTSKDELVLEAMRAYRDRVQSLRAQLASARLEADGTDDAPVDLPAALRRVVDDFATFLAGERPIVRLSLDATGLPDAVRAVIGDAWDAGYGILADVFEHHGVPAEQARVLSISGVGALNHYVSHAVLWRQPPAGVDAATYLGAWVDQFAQLAAAAVDPAR